MESDIFNLKDPQITKDKSGNIEYVRASNEVKKLMQNVDNS